MSVLRPFRALRPTPAVAARVAAVPYDVVSREEASALARDPLSFLRVSRAEVGLPPQTDPYSDAVYDAAATNLQRLTAEAPLVREETPRLYVYRLRMAGHVQTGVAGCFSLAEYERGDVKKHEHTRRDKEDDRTRHMLAVRAQTGPVFLTFRAAEDIDTATAGVSRTAPLFDFTAGDHVQHTLWRVDGDASSSLVEAFARVPALYIADGHHRAASAARVRQQHGGQPGEWDTFLAVAFPHNQVQILPYNRVVADLRGATPAEFLSALQRVCSLHPGSPSPVRAGQVSMFLDNAWYTLDLGDAGPGRPRDQRLDVSRLQELVLTPLLGIGDIRADERIDFVGGGRGTAALESLVRSGRASVAFSMYPVSIEDLMEISDAGGIMPPKSTWFEPKLRDGLLVHEL